MGKIVTLKMLTKKSINFRLRADHKKGGRIKLKSEIYIGTLDTISQKKILELDNKTLFIFQKKFSVIIAYNKLVYFFDERKLNDFLNFLKM